MQKKSEKPDGLYFSNKFFNDILKGLYIYVLVYIDIHFTCTPIVFVIVNNKFIPHTRINFVNFEQALNKC